MLLLLACLGSVEEPGHAPDAHEAEEEAHQDVVNRFNERFILSLASNHAAIFLDDNLNLLPVSSHVRGLEKVMNTSSYGVSLNGILDFFLIIPHVRWWALLW